MKNELRVFNNGLFGEVRFIEVDGKPYAVANDVLRVLGYAEGGWRTTLSRKCKGVAKCNVPHPQSQNKELEISIIPEGDIYRLIVGSKLPSAEKFERWVFDEVLPSIRKDGGYIVSNEEESDAEIMARALLVAQKTIERKNQKIMELEPKAEVYDRFIDQSSTWGFRELRKELESTLNITIKENEFKEVLKEKGWIGTTLRALAYAIRNQYMVTKDVKDKFDNLRTQDRFTEKARKELLDFYKNN